ncbi:UbiA family prenyltransferase [Candidatus Uabimicrobium sp. HlEnr_7]|uniref:UbiA family prenyltransferase n=1 Tax=Candidatus Uabimicrobium helgolandensis TaxID=3095367 RepID=UPI0035580075
MSRFIAYLKMSRVSNLPTVWANCMVAIAATGNFSWLIFVYMSGICSLFYSAGMILNDVCDSEIDRKERPNRPIPAGIIKRQEALIIAIFVMLLGVICCQLLYSNFRLWHIISPILLVCVIVLYNMWHKGNYFSPLVMASCRFMVYFVAALSTTDQFFPIVIIHIALVASSYIVGLTYMAMQENLNKIKNYWPMLFLLMPFVYSYFLGAQFTFGLLAFIWVLCNVRLLYNRKIKQAIGGLISGVCLVDAMLLSTILPVSSLLWCFVLLFICTFFAQKFIPGT